MPRPGKHGGRHALAVLLFAGLAVRCGAPISRDVSGEAVSGGTPAFVGSAGRPRSSCEERITEITSPAESTPLGFTATEAQERVTGKFRGTLSWTAPAAETFADAPAAHDTTMTIEITPTGALRVVDEVKPAGAANDRLSCAPSRIEIGATVAIATEDGTFVGASALALRVESRDKAGFSATLVPADLGGTFKAKPRDPRAFTFKLTLTGRFTGAGKLSGTVDFTGSRMTGGGSTGGVGELGASIAMFAATQV